jgi:flagella basal body P-ring formation protein FlgA
MRNLNRFLILLIFQCSFVQANDVRGLIISEIGKQFPNTKIALSEKLNCEKPANAQIQSAKWLGEPTPGVAKLAFGNEDGKTVVECGIPFSASVQSRIAIRRIFPGEKISPSSFIIREVNIANGEARNFRGVILPIETNIAGLETRQTILEGQMLLSNSVQRTPDVRKGESVKILIKADDLVLTTTGTTDEPGFMNETIHVTSYKTKKQLSGKLSDGKVVEVKL